MQLKGHTSIELKNIKTGEIEKYEDDNLITNAIGKMVDFSARHCAPRGGSGWQNPYTTHLNLMSGLVCFDNPIENANADIIYPPNNVNPVAYGVAGATTDYPATPEFGVYNASDSSSTNTSRKWVFHWGTERGNGTISSVCLTNQNTGFCGFGMKDSRNVDLTYGLTSPRIYNTYYLGAIPLHSKKGGGPINLSTGQKVGSLSNASQYIDFCIDSDEDVKYMFRVASDGLYILKHSMQFDKFNPFKSCGVLQDYTEKVYIGNYTGTYFSGFYNTDEKALYYWTFNNAYYIANNTNITIYRYDMTSEEITNFSFLCNPGWNVGYLAISNSQKIFTIGDSSNSSDTNSKPIKMYDRNTGDYISLSTNGNRYKCRYKIYILNGFLYCEYGYKDKLLIVNLSNNEKKITPFSDCSYFYSSDLSGDDDNLIIPPYSNTQVVFGTMYNHSYIATYPSYLLNLEGSTKTYSPYGGLTCARGIYLATINNLNTPIIKNNEKEMTLTYTLTAIDI